MPLFVPDTFGPWSGKVCLAARVCRLGKCIAERFALRYIDAFSAVHVMHSPAAGNLSYIADNAIIQGEYVPLSDLGDTITLSVSRAPLKGPEEPSETARITVGLAELGIARAISRLSALTTFKTGDIIIFPSPAVDTDPENNKNTYITATVNGRLCIKFKIK